MAPHTLDIRKESGELVFSPSVYEFARDTAAPDSANPSLWRNVQLNAMYGLYQVTDGIYQVRGYDLANITFVRGEKGWIIFDCTTCVESA